MLDFAVAALPAFLLGAMGISWGLIGGDDRQRMLGQMLGALLVACAVLPFMSVSWTIQSFSLAIASGLLLGVGVFGQLLALKHLGISRAMPLSAAGQLIFVSLGGIVLFGELTNGQALPVALVSIVCLAVGVWFISRTEKNSDTSHLNWRAGGVLLAFSTVGLVAYPLFVRAFAIDGMSGFFPQTLACALVALVATEPRVSPWLGSEDRRWEKTTALLLIPGILWGAATLITMIYIQKIGVATAFPLAQMCVVIQTLGGIWILGEKRSSKEIIWTVIGVVIMTVGIVLVGVSKGLDVAL